jgi:two-component system, cell cycle sensor histidine kinase and response regulator CckA
MEQLVKKTRVLVVEDELVVSEDLQQRLVELGFEIAGAADTAADAIRLANSGQPDVALMDIMLHGRPEGIDAAEHLRATLDIPVIYLTAHSDSATLQRARLTDPSGYIVKPFDDEQLRVAIELAPHRHSMELKARRVAQWLTAALTSIGDAVIATNPRTEILFLNPAAEKLTGWTQDDAAGKLCAEVVRLVNESTGQALEDPAARALRHGLVIRLDSHTVLITRTGEERRVDDSAAPITDQMGTILGAVLVVVDATDRLAGRNRVQALTREVAQLLAEEEGQEMPDAELEAFAAAVNRDVRSPLDAIAGRSGVLAESYREQIGASGRLLLDRVRANTQQMSRMVEDYLTFLRSTRDQPLRREAVNLERVAQAVFADMPPMPGQKPARFVCETLPQTWGDEALLRRVLVNLLDNALKYSAQREEPVVEVGAVPGEALHTFFVRDNGRGLDLQDAATLFEPIPGIRSAADVPGSGAGLRIVKRIVERHGGVIWAESQPGAGATFFFKLPAKLSSLPQPA